MTAMPRLTPTERAYAEGYRAGQLAMRRRVREVFDAAPSAVVDALMRLRPRALPAAPKRKRRAK